MIFVGFLALFSAPVQGVPYQLGRGYDMAKLSLWNLEYTSHLGKVLDWGEGSMPTKCYDPEISHCSAHSKVEIDEFKNTAGAFNYIASTSSFGATGSYKAVTATVKSAFKNTESSRYFSNSAGAFGNSINVQKCHRINYECLLGKGKHGLGIDSEFLLNVDRMDLDPTGKDTDLMRNWQDKILTRYGTHLVRGVDNGAGVKLVSHADSDGQSVSQCAGSKVCAKLSAFDVGALTGKGEDWDFTKFDGSPSPKPSVVVKPSTSTTKPAGRRRKEDSGFKALAIDGCHSPETCAASNSSSYKWGSNCATVGGDPRLSSRVCLPGAKRSDIVGFLTTGDVDSTHSVVNMHFTRLDKLLSQFGVNRPICQTMEKAIDYHLCVNQNSAGDKSWAWENGQCMCKRTCGLGGTIDPQTCTCQCKGNDKHGFKGPNCEHEYGKCQVGPLSGNRKGADRCPIDGTCSSWFSNYECRASEVCCLSNISGGCCPHGSTCNCWHDNCKCILPSGQETWPYSSTWERHIHAPKPKLARGARSARNAFSVQEERLEQQRLEDIEYKVKEEARAEGLPTQALMSRMAQLYQP